METITAGQLAAWLSSHQSVPSGEQTRQMSVSQPDANGVTTYMAPDGSTLSVRGSGDNLEVVDRQETQAATAPTPSLQEGQPSPSVQPTAGVGTTNQQQLEARLAAQPGLVYRGQTARSRSVPADDLARTPAHTEQIPVVTWVEPSTGHTLAAEVQPGGGSYTVIQDAVVPGNKVTPAQERAPQGASAPQGRVNPSDPTRMQQWNPTSKAWDDAGPNQVEIERRAKEAAVTARQAVVDAKPGAPTLKPDGKGGTVAVQEMPNGTIKVTPVPGIPSDVVSAYSEVRQDPDTKKWWGLARDGKGWAEIPGGPGSAKPSGTPMPSMPEIVLGHSQDALRELKDKLQQGVAAGQWTQAQADNQWKDAYETAQTTVNEATVLNSKNQSELNASTNLANARLQASTSGFNNALNFIGKLNANLPAGSTLGAKAFMGLLGLQAMSAMQSGAYSGIVPGSQTLGGPSTYRSPTAIATPTSSVTAAAVAAPVGGPTPPLNQGQDLSTPSVAPSSLPAAPARPAAATSAPPVAASAGAPPASAMPPAPGTPPTAITAEQAAAYERGGINPATGDIDARGTPAGGAPQDTATIFQAGPRPLQPGDPGYPYQPQAPGAIPPASPIPSDVPQGVDQDMVTVRMPSGSGTMQVPRFMVGEGPGKYAPSQGWQVIEVPQSRMMAPANDFAVLRGAPPGVALAPQAPPSAYEGLPDVVRRTAIAGQLPWRVSPEDIQWAEQKGYGADWRQMPGAAA